MKFRKRPVVIEAMQFDGFDNSYLDIVEWMKRSGDTHALADEVEYRTPIMLINTMEGTMAASPGDWIIRGVQGEFYPCKPDIFEQTYELVGDGCARAVPDGYVQVAVRCETCHGDPHRVNGWTCPDCINGWQPTEGVNRVETIWDDGRSTWNYEVPVELIEDAPGADD